jgi:hypothetical protein
MVARLVENPVGLLEGLTQRARKSASLQALYISEL